ncbi:helix-turn-helix domain-containing protein [Flavivirga eckloniae]|uniref:XRE family transcriptional regulator n=1 Tax=Flavivirga eckloniae TaxID=1803846 RepID=A0A2K9PMQ7_9FLAO|nr:helix-turn-helix transcriptional regulator [Flavivirga eckloniae]AUP78315.1 XRE family transcriptional regulator [Flavivirga eckloniae]
MLRIDEILKEKRISNSEFASMIGVSETSASAFKSGKTKPKFDTLVKIAEVLDVDIRQLFKPTKGGELLNGFVEYEDEIYRIYSKEDLQNLLNTIK